MDLLFAIAFKIEKRATNIAVAIVERVLTIGRVIKKKKHESIYKTDTKNEVKSLRLTATTFANLKLEER